MHCNHTHETNSMENDENVKNIGRKRYNFNSKMVNDVPLYANQKQLMYSFCEPVICFIFFVLWLRSKKHFNFNSDEKLIFFLSLCLMCDIFICTDHFGKNKRIVVTLLSKHTDEYLNGRITVKNWINMCWRERSPVGPLTKFNTFPMVTLEWKYSMEKKLLFGFSFDDWKYSTSFHFDLFTDWHYSPRNILSKNACLNKEN